MKAKIAVVGSGITGLVCAYLLKDQYEVTLYEKGSYFGGHTNTIDIVSEGKKIAVDTGFIVFNKMTYPNLVPFFEQLGVDYTESDMSFGVSSLDGRFQYSSSGLSGFFAQRMKLLSPRRWKLLLDIIRFNKIGSEVVLDSLKKKSIDIFLDDNKMSKSFRQDYLYPVAGAIWSTPVDNIGNFPAYMLIQFFRNHALLTLNAHHQWYTVKNGSRSYVEKIIASDAFEKKLNTPVTSVSRVDRKVLVKTQQCKGLYDNVIFACHAPDVLKVLSEPYKDELSVLSKFQYSPNMAYLHRDKALMPSNKRAWASWSYLAGNNGKMGVSYWMNSLQSLKCNEDIFVTLNPPFAPKPELTERIFEYKHPLFDDQAIEAQDSIADIQGHGGVWYCGAYQRYGFHEDGIWSALRVVNALGVQAPWQ